MKVSISLLTFLEFRHLQVPSTKAKLVPFISEMSNIRIKIELLLAAYYAVFSVWFKSQRNICSTIVCNSVVVNLVISSSYESTVQCNVRSFYFPNRFHLLQIKKAKIVGFELGKEIQKDVFSSCCECGKRKSSEIPCYCVFVELSLVIDHMGATLCLINHNLCLG